MNRGGTQKRRSRPRPVRGIGTVNISFSPKGPTVDQGLPPDPPTGDEDGGSGHRGEHKPRLMLALSYFIRARVVAVSNLAEMSRGYAQEIHLELALHAAVFKGARFAVTAV